MKKDIKFYERQNGHYEYIIDMLMGKVIEREKEVSDVKKELHISNARIVDLQRDVDVKSDSSTPHQNSDKDGDFDIVGSATNFSSRFMPNVKFKIPYNAKNKLIGLKLFHIAHAEIGCFEDDFSFIGTAGTKIEDTWKNLKEVSIYEAIPELIPEGMYYSGESGSLVAFKSLYEEMITFGFNGTTYTDIEISDFAKKLAITQPFNCSQVQWVVDIFGEDKCEKILDMVTVCGFDLSDVEPLKK